MQTSFLYYVFLTYENQSLGALLALGSTKFGFMSTKLTMNQNSDLACPWKKHWCTTLIWSWASWLLCRHIHSRLFDDYFENRRMITCILRVSRLMASPHSLRTLVFRLPHMINCNTHWALLSLEIYHGPWRSQDEHKIDHAPQAPRSKRP